MEENDDSFDEGNKRFRFWALIIGAALLALVAMGWLGRPYYRHYKERHSLALAEKFLAGGDYRSALLSIRQTIALNPTNAAACRVMATLAELSHSPSALDWQMRAVQAEPTIENKLTLAMSAMRYQSAPFPLTAQILDELAATATATNLASYQVVAASLALGTRRLAEAESHFETATKLEPTNRLYELNLAIIRLSSTNEAKVAASRAVLEKLKPETTLGPPALRALVVDRLAHQDAAAANDYSMQLLARPLATLADRLQHLGILQQLKSAEFPSELLAVQKQGETNAAGVAEVSAWMQGNGLLAENIQWLTQLPANRQAQTPVRLALANGYLQGADWSSLRSFASKGNWDEMEFLRLALVARTWMQYGEPAVADKNWNAAVSEAGSRYGSLTMLLGLADRWQWRDKTTGLLEQIVEKFPQESWAQHALELQYLATGNTVKLLQLYAQLFSIFPKNDGLKNNLAATSLLLKTNVPQACQWAAEVYAGRSNDLIVASTYAFALHLQGRTKDGLAAMQKLDDRLLHQPDAAIYYGILLAASGAKNEAAPFLKIAQSRTQWLPEEKLLLAKALGEL